MIRARSTFGAPNRRTSWTTRISRMVRLVASLVRMRIGTAWLSHADPGALRDRVQAWAADMLEILNIRVVVSGYAPSPGDGVLLVANHISWLDIQALGSINGARFVAKSEVRRWPLAGAVAQSVGTFFHLRGSCRDAWRTKNRMAVALRGGESVAVFPEGTTTDGKRVQAFYPALLQAAVDARASICPVTIRYQSLNGTGNAAAAFLGDMSIASSLRRLLREPAMAVELCFGPLLSPRNRTRRELAALSQLAISETLAHATDHRLLEALRSAPQRRRTRIKPTLGRGTFPPAQAPAAA